MPRSAKRYAWRTRFNLVATLLVFALIGQMLPAAPITSATAVETASVKIFFPDMHSRLGAKILATVTTAGAARLKITATGPSGYNQVLADAPSPTAADAHVASMDLRGLAAGTYTLTANVTDAAGTLIGQKVRTFNKPMSGTPRVGFDENNALYVNGQLTPVIGTWWGNYAGSWSPQYLPALKQAGRITTAEVIDGARSAATWATALDQSAANGVTAIGPTIAGQTDIPNIVNTSKGKSALLSWMFMDEPEYSGVAASTVRGWTDTAHSLDPDHPVMVNMVGPMFVNQGGSQATARSFTSDLIGAEKNGAVDWYSSDYYPIAFSPNFGMTRQTSYDKFAEHLVNLRSFTKDLYPLKTFIEIGSMPELNSTTVPKPNEIWAQVWIAVAKGVRSISWFPVDSTGSAVTDPGTPAMQQKAVTYLNRYTPMLAQADSNKVTRTHTAGSGRVDFIAKEYGGKLYVFAVNRDVSANATVRFDLSGFSASSVSVYDENRTVALNGTSFTDSFAPYGVHVYEISGSTATTPPVTAAPTGTMSLNGGGALTNVNAVTVDSAVSGATNMRFDTGSGYGAWAPYAATAPLTLPAGDGTKTVSAQYQNAGGTLTVTDTIELDTTAPTGWFTIDNGATKTASTNVSIQNYITGATKMRVSTGGAFGAWTPYAESLTVALPAGDGTKSVAMEYADAAGNVHQQATTILLETPNTVVAPSGAMALNGGAAVTNSTSIRVDSAVTGATSMRCDTGSGFAEWHAYDAGHPLTLPAGDGLKTVTAQYQNAGGTLTVTDTIMLDTGGPTGWFTVNNGTALTNSNIVSVQNYVTDATQMRFATGGDYGQWMPYAATTSLTLPPGDGLKPIVVQYMDAAGNVLQQSTYITLDATAPTGRFTVNKGATRTKSRSVSIQNYVTGATRMRFATGADYSVWTTYTASSKVTLPAGDGVKVVTAQYSDAAGNVLDLSASIVLDTTSPSGRFVLNGGAASTTSRILAVRNTVTGATKMRFRSDGYTRPWMPYASTARLAVSSQPGTKTVYGHYMDAAGNVLYLQDTIRLTS